MASSTGISFTGLGSGLDTESIITQLLYLDSAPIRLLETKKTYLDYEREALQDVNTSLLALKDTIKQFRDGILLNNSAVSSDEDVVTASATAAATPGVYTIAVTQLAQEHRVASDAIPGGIYGGANDTFTISIGGNNFNVNVSTGQTLENVAQAINNTNDGGTNFMEKALATVITDPSTGNKTLVITSNDEGAVNALSFTDGGGGSLNTLGVLAGAAIKNELQAAQDALATINGVPVSSSSNSLTGAVVGVDFNLKNFGTADVTVGLDTDALVTMVKDFVDQFNATTDKLAGYVKEEKVSDPETTEEQKQGILQGDFDLAQAKSNIRLKTTGYIDLSLADYKILADIGIESEGSFGSSVSDNITLDEDKLRAALDDDKDQVADLLQGFADDLDTYLDSETKVTMVDSMAGNFYRRILNIDERQDAIDDDIATWEDRIASIEARYRAQWSAMEQLLASMNSQSSYLQQQLSNLSGFDYSGGKDK